MLAGAVFAIVSGQVLWWILPALLIPNVIVSSLGLPRVLREERINRRVIEEMGAAGEDR